MKKFCLISEEEGSGGKNQMIIILLETVNNFNLCVILNIFQTGLWKHYQEMNIGDNWELAFDKKTWDEGGEKGLIWDHIKPTTNYYLVITKDKSVG